MYKLGALDAGFLYNETERCPHHIASVQVLEPLPGTVPGEFVARLKALLLERVHLVPYFTNKLQRAPFDLDHPVWVRDGDFDIDHHVRTIEVPAPGGREEFEATIAELHATPLDMSRPLWDLWVLTGLEGGRYAYYNRAHHACLDGMAGQKMIETIMDVTPEPRKVTAPPLGFFAAQSETPTNLLVGALENFARHQVKQSSIWMNQLETTTRLIQRAMDPSKGLGAAAEVAPRTRFNRTIERSRTYASGELSLADVKAVAKATGTKINDVFLAVIGGALRRYLRRKGELPSKPLIAGCPVSLRQAGDESTNNQVTMMLVSCASDEADPIRRLLKVAASSAQAKGLTADTAGSYDPDPALPGLPNVLAGMAQLIDRYNLADLDGVPLPCNLVVSNVPGPVTQLYSNGAKMLTHYPVSLPVHGQGLNITVQSYLDEMFFAVTACAKALPDAGRLRDDMLEEFAELREAMGPSDAMQHDAANERAPLPSRPQVVDGGSGAEIHDRAA